MYSRDKRRKKCSSTREQETPKATKEKTAVEQKISRRTNWGVGDNKKKMERAVDNWNKKTGNAVDCNGEQVALKTYSTLTSIPYNTLVKYITGDANKQHKVGCTIGQNKILDDDTAFVVDV